LAVKLVEEERCHDLTIVPRAADKSTTVDIRAAVTGFGLEMTALVGNLT
jgi:hypothetical protein